MTITQKSILHCYKKFFTRARRLAYFVNDEKEFDSLDIIILHNLIELDTVLLNLSKDSLDVVGTFYIQLKDDSIYTLHIHTDNYISGIWHFYDNSYAVKLTNQSYINILNWINAQIQSEHAKIPQITHNSQFNKVLHNTKYITLNKINSEASYRIDNPAIFTQLIKMNKSQSHVYNEEKQYLISFWQQNYPKTYILYDKKVLCGLNMFLTLTDKSGNDIYDYITKLLDIKP